MALSGKSLDAATTTGPGSVISFDEPKSSISLQVTTTGNPTYTVVVEVSLDGFHFFSGGGRTSDGITPMGLGAPTPVVAARANLTSLSGGTSPTVTAFVAASD